MVYTAAALRAMSGPKKDKLIDALTEAESFYLNYDWPFWARPEQLAPANDEWGTWLILAGRGFGKTRTGAEWVRDIAENGGPETRIALVAPTAADARDVMVEGESGILGVCPSWNFPLYEPSKRKLTWPNGATAHIYSADKPERLRGPQHTHAWCDELCAWQYQQDAWDMLMFGMRLGDNPRVVITTTPKPTKTLMSIVNDDDTHLTKGTTYDNLDNLSKKFRKRVISKYEGTRLGRQELNAEILSDVAGALWIRSDIDSYRRSKCPDIKRIVVAIDPPTTSGENADECGIVVAGVGVDGRGYILADLSEQGLTPLEWATKAVKAFHEWDADKLVAEVNQGGDMVETIIREVDKKIPYKGVHATKGKVVRAEPVAALYEQGKISHLGTHANLEDQMCQFTLDFDKKSMGYSPDRIDALVWAITELMLLEAELVPRVRRL